MSKRTVVSDYIENKLNNIKKDSFLEEVASSNLCFYKQREIINKEIENIREYIKIIKENKKCYEVINNKKVLKKSVKLYISNLRKIINKYLEYSKCLKLLEKYQTRKDLIEKRIEFESNEVKLTDSQYNLLKELNEERVNNITFNDLGDICKCLINNYESYNSKLDFCIKELGSRHKYSEYNEEEYIILSSVKGAINNKLTSFAKDDYRRIKLKEYKKYIKSVIDVIREKQDKKYDYRYDIVIYLINDEYCFDSLLEQIPDVVNLCDKDGFSLAFNVLEKYLDAYLLELQGKSKGKNKEDILKIYHKIISHPYYNCSDNNIEELLEHFTELIKNGKFRREKYIEVLNNLENINKVIKEETVISDINQSEVIEEMKFLLSQNDYTFRTNLCDEDTIVLCSKNEKHFNYAYSINKNSNGNHILKVHIADVVQFIKHGSLLDSYLKDNISKGENNWLNEELLSKFSLNLNDIKPAFTFEMEVNSKGKIINFTCYKSNIMVNDIYTYEEANKEIKNHNLRFLTYLETNYFLNKNINKDNYALSMVDTFNEIVFNNIGEYFDKNKLPYIYKEQKEQDNSRYFKNMTVLNSLFSKISRENFKKFYNIICDDINYSRYTNKPGFHSSLNQKYYTDLFIPLYSYIGLFNQEMLSQFYLNKDSGEILNIKKKIWLEKRDFIIKKANELKRQKRNNEHKDKIKKLRGIQK